eukprot:458704-Amphidinium_carterae.1
MQPAVTSSPCRAALAINLQGCPHHPAHRAVSPCPGQRKSLRNRGRNSNDVGTSTSEKNNK